MFPEYVEKVLTTLEKSGHAAYVVGGCVRDRLLQREAADWDVTTDALPEEVLAAFGGFAIPTGLQHGTVTVRSDGNSMEVTTFRCDGAYRDSRHPESVSFTSSLREDLARRDFTVNAMAMDVRGELVDIFDGQEDLRCGVLRCVGDARVRFDEDALRILRALRFAATYGFTIEEKTAVALHEKKELLKNISAERVFAELTRLICGEYAASILLEYPDVIGVWVPEVLPCVGFDQKSRFHVYDVWEHSVRAMASIEAQPRLRWHMLFHDLGKPGTYTEDEQGRGHTYGHTALSAKIAEPIMERLRFPGAMRERVRVLLAWHDAQFAPTREGVLRVLSRIGPEALEDLLKAKRADNAAKRREGLAQAQRPWNEAEETMRALLEKGEPYTAAQLSAGGEDMMALGLRGSAVGEMLRMLLERVMEGELPNEKSALIAWAREHITK